MFERTWYRVQRRPLTAFLLLVLFIWLLIWVFIYSPHESIPTCGNTPVFGDKRPALPSIVHMYQIDDSPLAYAVHAYGNEKRSQVMSNSTQVITWNRTMFVEWMEINYAWYLPLFATLTVDEQRRVAPYFILPTFGGLFISTAYIPYVDLFPYLSNDRITLLESYTTYEEPYSDAILASPPGHAFWKILHTRLLDGAKVRASLLSSVTSTHSEMTYVLPCANFNRIPERIMSSVKQHTRWTKKCGVESDPCLYGSVQGTRNLREYS